MNRKVRSFDLFSSHAWYVPDVGGMFVLLGFFMLGSILSAIVMAIMLALMGQQAVSDYGMIVIYPVTFIPAMIYAAHRSQKNALFDPGYKLVSCHFGKLGVLGVVCLTAVMTVATMLFADPFNWFNFKLTESSPLLQKFYEAIMESMKQMTGGPFWSSFLVTAIFAPIFEEWLCRGMVLRGLLCCGKVRPGWAIVISALFFAVIHANPWQALNAFIIGLVMGYIYYRTGNLWLTMLVHFINNGSAVVMMHMDSLKDMEYWKDVIPEPAYWVVVAVAAVVLYAGVMLLRKIPMENKRGNIDPVDAVV